MDLNTFANVMDNNLSNASYAAMLNDFNKLLADCGCNTPRRVAMLCAQVAHESLGLYYMNEEASGAAYEWRSDLGNVRAGDGVRFKGHGPIQVTGRANHAACSRWAYDHGKCPTPTFFVDHPEMLGQGAYRFVGVQWYWTVHSLNSYADNGDVRGATYVINGGYNGLANRQRLYNKAIAYGDALLPNGGSGNVRLDGIDQKAAKALQRVVGTTQDGIIGPLTIAAFEKRMRANDGNLVVKVQHYLNGIRSGWLKTHPNDKKIYGPLAEDNVWGPRSAAAMSYYLTRLNGGFTNA